jgi:hypothetical protein
MIPFSGEFRIPVCNLDPLFQAMSVMARMYGFDDKTENKKTAAESLP